MDEDFKIVIAAELDETKSMQNIMASLNHIQAKVKETQIKIPVDVNNANSQQAASNIKQIEKNVVSANKQTKTFGDTLKNALNIGSAAAVTAKAIQLIRNAAKDAVEAVKDFDSAITNLRTATGKDYETVKQWVVSYNQMGQALGATTTEVADSANTWLRQGKTVSEANSLIKTTMMLSKVGMLDSADAAKYLTSAMKGYHVSVEDAVGIVDKLTGVDAHAAVSAGDLAVAMSRTAETAADAGISMDKLLGYLAAVGEVTQKDMSSIGNAFKTVFTRMADIKSGKLELIDVDGTTEILSDVETVLNGLNIKLRKSDNEFRNFGDVLDEVAAKWDTYSDVQQAALAKAFAGTRQQENFRVLMANYDKAREYMDVAADSAGSAEKKFGAYLDSIEAKTKSLQAAFESLAINTFSTEMLGGIIGATAGLVEFLDKAGILKATLLSLGAGATLKGVQMIATGFKNISQNVLNLGESINILRRVGNVSNLTGETIKKLGTLTKGLGSDQLRLVLTSRQLSTAQMQAILMASGLTKEEAAQRLETLGLAASQKTAEGATWSLSSAMQGLGASIKATFVANPIGATMMAISAATVVVSLLANAWEEAKQKAEEARQAMSDAAKAVNDQRNSLADLIAEYKELATAGDFDSSARDTAKRIQQDITDLVGQQAENLDLVNGKLDDEIEKLDNIRLQNAYNARDTLDTKFRDAKSQFEAGVEATDSGTNAFGVIVDESSINQILQKIGYVNEAWENVNGQISFGYAASKGNAEEVLAMYKELQHLLLNSNEWQSLADDPWSGWIGVSSQDILNNVQKQIEFYEGLVDEYNSAQQNFLENEAVIDLGETLKTTDINSQEAFDTYIQGIKDSTEYSEAYKNILLDLAYDTFPEFGNAAQQVVTDSSPSVYVAQLGKLTDIISGLKESYKALESAQEDMAGGGGLSADTIESLASAEENYLDYLYEENGVVKLNTEAWKENANAKMLGEMNEIQKEIDSLNEQNDALRDNIAYYEEQRRLGSDGGMWSNLIAQTTADIEENNKAIEENQAKLAIYSSLYGSITGDLDVYTAALQNFSNVADSIDSITGSFQTLANLQAEVANGFTMSLDKALEFAKVYPEILNSAQATADGQIMLNEGVVNSFIEGKKAELDAQIDAEVAKLEADKEVLQAKMEAAQAQLDLAKSVAEGEGDISKELAEYRINAGNAVAQALIDAGIDEATAFKLAAAMAQNTEEFDRVAMEVCTDVNGNFNQAAYDLAQTMYNNLTNVKTDLASVATQAHETAKAIAGVANGSVAGSSAVQGGSGGGTGSSGIKLNLTSGSFEETEYTYTAKESGLEDFISQVELDISNYQDAISQIDGQIAALQALKNAPLKNFQSSDTGGSGKGGGSSNSTKDVEEYIASIDEYREAVECLRKAQEYVGNIETNIDESDDLKEKIFLEKQLISAYQNEQDALSNLNDLRASTITDGVAVLRELGFAVEYNADANELWISNMEHLNELTADSKGEYSTLQEATNALRKDTEDLIGTLEDLNKENRDGSSTWLELKGSIKDTKLSIVNDLQEIVNKASDAVDEIQNVSDTLYEAADEFAKNDGFITIDTWRALRKVGMQYMQLLKNENNEWEINEERINAVIAARTRQMAVENAMSYVERIKLATQEGAVENLNDLIFVTTDATNSTWGLVYAELELMHIMGDLNDSQYQAALHNIQAMQDLAENAVQNIGKATDSVEENLEETRKQLEDTKKGLQDLLDELEDMEDGANDLVKYVMDMLKHRIQEQIDLLEEMKDKYSEIIDLKKDSLDATKDEQDYQKSIAKKLREMAKLQERINALSLDDSRSAQAERAKLLEEMAELQEDLADSQADKSIESQKEALDQMEKNYHEEKDKEIKILEDSISSYQKLYDMAIDYIRNNWDTLYQELIEWNTEYGSVLNSEITEAWEAAQAAAHRYGDFVSAIMDGISAEIDSITKQIEALDEQISNLSTSSGSLGTGGVGTDNRNTTVGNKTTHTSPSDEDMVRTIVGRMKESRAAWDPKNNKATNDAIHQNVKALVSQLDQYGVHADYRDSDGTWWITRDELNPGNVGKKLNKCYHTGGFVGDRPLKPNEQYIKAENGELMMTSSQQDSLVAQLDRISAMTDVLAGGVVFGPTPAVGGGLSQAERGTINNITNNSRPIEINVGDTIIQGNASAETVAAHGKMTEKMVNDLARMVGVKW